MKQKEKTYYFKRCGFTLLEVLLAMTVFVIVLSALYYTFSIGTKTFSLGEARLEVNQTARVILDRFERDLSAVFYMEESDYNQTLRARMEELDNLRMRAEEVEMTLEDFLKEQKGIDEFTETEQRKYNPYFYTIPIDLKFEGKKQELSFVIQQSYRGYRYPRPWGLARIDYSMQDKELRRQERNVFMPPKDLNDEPVEVKEPQPELLAGQVEELEFRYGYFFDGQWLETPEWDSEVRRYRNPMPELDPDDPEYQRKYDRAVRRPNDQLPAYVALSLSIKDSRGKLRESTGIFPIWSAQETYVQPEDEEEEYED